MVAWLACKLKLNTCMQYIVHDTSPQVCQELVQLCADVCSTMLLRTVHLSTSLCMHACMSYDKSNRRSGIRV